MPVLLRAVLFVSEIPLRITVGDTPPLPCLHSLFPRSHSAICFKPSGKRKEGGERWAEEEVFNLAKVNGF